MWRFGHFWAKFWPEKITSRDGCFLPILPLRGHSCLEATSRKLQERSCKKQGQHSNSHCEPARASTLTGVSGPETMMKNQKTVFLAWDIYCPYSLRFKKNAQNLCRSTFGTSESSLPKIVWKLCAHNFCTIFAQKMGLTHNFHTFFLSLLGLRLGVSRAQFLHNFLSQVQFSQNLRLYRTEMSQFLACPWDFLETFQKFRGLLGQKTSSWHYRITMELIILGTSFGIFQAQRAWETPARGGMTPKILRLPSVQFLAHKVTSNKNNLKEFLGNTVLRQRMGTQGIISQSLLQCIRLGGNLPPKWTLVRHNAAAHWHAHRKRERERETYISQACPSSFPWCFFFLGILVALDFLGFFVSVFCLF